MDGGIGNTSSQLLVSLVCLMLYCAQVTCMRSDTHTHTHTHIYMYIFDHCSRVIPTSYDAIVEMNDKGVGLAHVILFLSVLQLVFP